MLIQGQRRQPVGVVGGIADAVGEGEEAVELPAAGGGGRCQQGRHGRVGPGPARVLAVAVLLGGGGARRGGAGPARRRCRRRGRGQRGPAAGAGEERRR
uniref:Uncharacterized protein n=1 Tax=Arundo donax TaxID=35708 RepID=A0A0A9G2B6_ARUDO